MYFKNLLAGWQFLNGSYKQRWQAGFWLHQYVLRNSLAGSKKQFLRSGSILYYKKAKAKERERLLKESESKRKRERKLRKKQNQTESESEREREKLLKRKRKERKR